MSLDDLLAEARRQKSPADLERFLERACGTDMALRQEIVRQLASPTVEAPPSTATAAHAAPDADDTAPHPVASDDANFILAGAQIDVGIGDLLAGRYKIREEIGHGGMGTVFAADQVEPLERRVAVKVIRAGMDSNRVIARFAQEQQVLALMDHANIARIFDAGCTRLGRPYFVMELVRGLTFVRYCNQEKLSIRQRVELFISVCHAVQHAHQKGVIHRDLKPSNILVTLSDGKPTVKIIDFGVAKAVHQGLTEESVYTAHDAMIGTLEYMAPEQAALNSLDIDTRADIYSLGVVLYELLCGAPPFSRDEELRGSLDDAIRIIREVEPKRPSTRVSTTKDMGTLAAQRRVESAELPRLLRGDLDWVVMKCLEKERDRRYDTVQALAEDLQRYLREEPVLAAPPSTAYRIKKFVRRHSGEVTAAGIVLLLLIVGTIVASVGWARALDAKRLARDAEFAAKDSAEAAIAAELAAKDSERKAKDAERLANDEAAIHRALTRFIQNDMFDAIDPSERLRIGLPADANVQLRPLLDRVSQQIQKGRLKDQPLVEAALRFTLAKAYSTLGDNDTALEHAMQAEKLLVLYRSPEHPDRVDALEMVGQVHQFKDEIEAAVKILKDVLALRLRLDGPDHAKTLKTRYTVAILERRQGLRREAVDRLRQLLADQRRVLGDNREDTLRTQRALGETLTQQARAERVGSGPLFDEAAEILGDALKRWEQQFGPGNPGTLGTLNSFAYLQRHRGKLPEAEKLYLDLLKKITETKVYPDDHPLVAVYRTNLGSCLKAQNKLEEAIKVMRQAEPVLERVGASHQLTLALKSTLAAALASAGHDEEAASIYEGLPDRFIQVFGPDRPNTWEVIVGYITVQIQRDQRPKAVAVLTDLLKRQRTSKTPDSGAIARTAEALAAQYLALDQADRAASMLKEVLAELPAESAGRKRLQKVLAQLEKK